MSSIVKNLATVGSEVAHLVSMVMCSGVSLVSRVPAPVSRIKAMHMFIMTIVFMLG